MRVLVTGAGGFLGRALVRALTELALLNTTLEAKRGQTMVEYGLILALVIGMKRRSSLRMTPCHTDASSSCILPLKALSTSGRLSVTHATRSRSS